MQEKRFVWAHRTSFKQNFIKILKMRFLEKRILRFLLIIHKQEFFETWLLKRFVLGPNTTSKQNQDS